MSLCERIKSICDKRELSIYRVEKDCGFGNGSIMKWERSSPKVENIVKLADYFGVSVDYLLGREISLTKTAVPAERPYNDILAIEEIELILAENNGVDWIEKLYKELKDKQQRLYVLTWLVAYMASEGLPVKQILGK